MRFIYSYLEKPEEGDVELGGWTADLSKLTFDLAAAWVASRALKQTKRCLFGSTLTLLQVHDEQVCAVHSSTG